MTLIMMGHRLLINYMYLWLTFAEAFNVPYQVIWISFEVCSCSQVLIHLAISYKALEEINNCTAVRQLHYYYVYF